MIHRIMTLVGFYYYLSNKFILIISSTASIDLPNGAFGAHLDEFTLFQGNSNSLLSTAQDHYFGVYVYYADNNHSGYQYINYRGQFFLMNFEKSLVSMGMMYVPIC